MMTASLQGPGDTAEFVTLIALAEQEARDLGHSHVSTAHLFLALAQGDDAAGRALRACGATRDRLLPCVILDYATSDEGSFALGSYHFFTTTARGEMVFAKQEANRRGEPRHPVHLMYIMGFLWNATKVLRDLGITFEMQQTALVRELGEKAGDWRERVADYFEPELTLFPYPERSAISEGIE